MECISCGAELRPNARFCNVCGAMQPAQQPEQPQEQPVGTPSVAATEAARTPETSETSASAPMSNVAQEAPAAVETGELSLEEGDTAGRLKRPPRVLRAQDEGDSGSWAIADKNTTGGNQDILESKQQAGEALPFVVSREATIESAGATDHGVDVLVAGASDGTLNQDDEETRPTPVVRATGQGVPTAAAPDNEPAGAMAWADAETVETGIISASEQPVQTATMDAPEAGDRAADASEISTAAADEATSAEQPPTEPELMPPAGASSPHGLPWPLPISIIIGGRYRVESLVSAAADDPDGENIYRVSDLKGYERCWSCGQEYGEGTEASDRFCRECGADMLAREYLLYERRLPPEGATIDEANTAPEHPAVTGEMATDEERTFTQGDRAYRVVPRVTEPTPFPQGARILIGAATDIGITRAGERNEDSLGALVLNLAHDSHMQPLALGIVADGLGGHINGQDASRLTARMLTEHVLRKIALPLVSLPVDGVATEDGLKDILLEGAQAANAALCNANEETGADMGSTLVAALLFGGTAYIINVGDSRGYLFADGALQRITTDHSFVEQLIASGFVKPEDRYTHPQRNQILRSLGDDLDVEIDLFEQKLKPGVRLMLCSDGLWEMVRDDESARILTEAANPQEACDRLIVAANRNGGEDNISVVVIEVRD